MITNISNGDLLLVDGIGEIVVTDHDYEDLYLGTDGAGELRVFNVFQVRENLTRSEVNV